MLLVIHACIGMPMASLDCGKRFLDAHSISVKREYRQIEHLFVTDFTGSCPNDIDVEKDDYLIKLTIFPPAFISNLRTSSISLKEPHYGWIPSQRDRNVEI